MQLGIRFSEFYEHESCGKCTPCREGTRWLTAILRKLEDGRATQGDLDLLLDVCDRINGKCLCPLGDSDAIIVATYVAKFRDEFQAHIEQGGCPFGGHSSLDHVLAPIQMHALPRSRGAGVIPSRPSGTAVATMTARLSTGPAPSRVRLRRSRTARTRPSPDEVSEVSQTLHRRRLTRRLSSSPSRSTSGPCRCRRAPGSSRRLRRPGSRFPSSATSRGSGRRSAPAACASSRSRGCRSCRPAAR